MKTDIRISLLGGDDRVGQIADRWTEEGKCVRTFAVLRKGRNENDLRTALCDAQVVVLPVPFSRDGVTLFAPHADKAIRLDALRRLIPPDALVLAGGAWESAVNYAVSDTFQILNAVPTAEGAIQLAMEHSNRTLAGAKILVVGAGRIGTITAEKLKALDANVTVSARKEKDFALLRANGFSFVKTDEIALTAKQYDIVFNTVPAPVLTKEVLRKMKPSALLIDLASQPGGTDFEEASRLGIHAIHALGLPGKVAPLTASDILQTVLETEIEKRSRTI